MEGPPSRLAKNRGGARVLGVALADGALGFPLEPVGGALPVEAVEARKQHERGVGLIRVLFEAKGALAALIVLIAGRAVRHAGHQVQIRIDEGLVWGRHERDLGRVLASRKWRGRGAAAVSDACTAELPLLFFGRGKAAGDGLREGRVLVLGGDTSLRPAPLHRARAPASEGTGVVLLPAVCVSGHAAVPSEPPACVPGLLRLVHGRGRRRRRVRLRGMIRRRRALGVRLHEHRRGIGRVPRSGSRVRLHSGIVILVLVLMLVLMLRVVARVVR